MFWTSFFAGALIGAATTLVVVGFIFSSGRNTLDEEILEWSRRATHAENQLNKIRSLLNDSNKSKTS